MIMGRNKRNFDNGANSERDVIVVPKKPKKSEQITKTVKYYKKHKSGAALKALEKDAMKGRRRGFTDSSSSSESDSEKNSVKKSERSVTDSNSESGSDSDSDSSGSESSRESKAVAGDGRTPVKNSVTNLNPVPAGKVYDEPTAKSSGSDSYHSDTEEEDKKRRRRLKEIMKQQLTKKGKRRSPRKPGNLVSKRDVDEVEEEDAPPNSDEVLDWPQSDLLELIARMEIQIPERDMQKFDSRAARLNWDKIAFGNYSTQECRDAWSHILKRIRRFRKLSEILDDAKEWAKKPWTNFYRGSKKNQHPDMPTKPLSAYMIYYQEHKEKVMENHKGLDMMQISKIMTEMYKNLSDKEREKYSQKAAREKQKFEEKTAEFYRDHPEVSPPPQPTMTSAQSKALAREAVKGPKKPHPPFKLFFLEELKHTVVEGVADKKLVEENAREKWRNFSDKKKAEYIKMSLDELNRYEKEVKAYKQHHPDYTSPNYNKKILNKEERLILERLSGKPVKPPNSAYSLFSRYMLQSNMEVKSKAPKLRMAEISRKWRELSAPERHKYELNVKKLQEDYKLKLQRYLKSLTPEERERELDSVKKEKRKKKEKTPSKKSKNPETKLKKGEEDSEYPFFAGEPKPPPLRVYDLFVEKFLAERPSGVSEEKRLKQAPEYWEKLPESKKEALQEELALLKQKYVTEFGGFLKNLSAEQLKALSLRKAKAQKAEQEMSRINGSLSDSNDESDEEKYESSSEGSDSDDSESVISKKNGSESGRSKSSSSEDSDG